MTHKSDARCIGSALSVVVCLLLGSSVSGADKQATLFLLNKDTTSIRPGAVYVVNQKSPDLFLDLFKDRPINEASGWVDHREKKVADGIELSRVESNVCVHGILCRHDTIVWLLAVDVVEESISDPFECLEIVNRPLSHLAYNRDAEVRIAQWRASMHAAISKYDERSDASVSLCTKIIKLRKGYLATRGDAKHELLLSASKKYFGDHASKQRDESAEIISENGCQYLKVEDVLLGAVFRKIELNEGGSLQRVAFKMGEDERLTVIK